MAETRDKQLRGIDSCCAVMRVFPLDVVLQAQPVLSHVTGLVVAAVFPFFCFVSGVCLGVIV